MTEVLLLLTLAIGGVIGWLIRHWYYRRDLAAQRRDQQLQQVTSISSNSNSSSRKSTSSISAQESGNSSVQDANLGSSDRELIKTQERVAELEAQLSNVQGDYSDLTQSFTFKDEEIDELYQIASKVKPLEFELAKTRAEVQRLKSQTTESGSETGSWTSSHTETDLDELYKTASRVKPLEFELSKMRTELESYRNDSTMAFMDSTESVDRSAEIDELYQTASRVKPLEHELRRKVAEIEKLKKLGISNRALSDGGSDDRNRALQAEIEDLKQANKELLQSREKSEKRALELQTAFDDVEQKSKSISTQSEEEIQGLRLQVEESRKFASELEQAEQRLLSFDQTVEHANSLESLLSEKENDLIAMRTKLSEQENVNRLLIEQKDDAEKSARLLTTDHSKEIDELQARLGELDRLTRKTEDQHKLIETLENRSERLGQENTDLQNNLVNAERQHQGDLDSISQLEKTLKTIPRVNSYWKTNFCPSRNETMSFSHSWNSIV